MSKANLDLEDFDFGFSAVDESELASSQKAAETGDKLEKMYKMIVPLLDNLLMNPEKDYIYWPDRVKKVEQFKKKLKNLLDS